jgi:DnaJ-class molecular chaperone
MLNSASKVRSPSPLPLTRALVVSSAFTTLTDAQLKATYDRSGISGLGPLAQQQAQQFAAQMRAILILELSRELSNLFANSSLFTMFPK